MSDLNVYPLLVGKVGSKPKRFVFGGIFVCLLFSIGNIFGETNEANEMWYPHKSQAYKDSVWAAQVFGLENRTGISIVVAGPGAG